jgi:hypothetical protein
VNTESLTITVIRSILQVALIGALVAAGWNIYRRLPVEDQNASNENRNAETELLIVLRVAPDYAGNPLNIPVDLYPFDVSAAEPEFRVEPHPGRRLDDFLAQRAGDGGPLKTQLDDQGRGSLGVPRGNWWLHATLGLPDDESLEWRLALSVMGRRQTIELTPENAYQRTKKF